MFKFNYQVIKCTKDEVLVKNYSSNDLENMVAELIESFELDVHNKLLDIQSFDYVQGTVGVFKLFNELKKTLNNEFEIQIITQHPNFIGSKLIEELIPKAKSGKFIYLIYFIEPISNPWLNSKANSSQLKNTLKQLNDIATLKNEISFHILEIFGSDLMSFIQINAGNKNKPRWIMKKNK